MNPKSGMKSALSLSLSLNVPESLLPWFRRLARRAWWLNVWLLVSLVMMPVPSASLADEEGELWVESPIGEFYYVQTESLLEVQMGSTLGCSGHVSGCAVPVTALVTERA